MTQRSICRPEEAAMLRLLENCRGSMSEIVLRLAWQAGLRRDELISLRWDQVELPAALVVAGRRVPLTEELALCLAVRKAAAAGPEVVWSDRRRSPMAPESVSRLARTALDGGGLPGVSLMDLRHDFIIRQLECRGWPYAVQVSGISVNDLYARFSRWMPPREETPSSPPASEPDEFQLWKILQTEGNSPAGLTLWLCWKLGLQAREVAALTWEQVDLSDGVVHLPDRSLPLGERLTRLLEQAASARTAGEDPHVLLTPQSRSPYDPAALSRLVRTALIRGGLEHVTLRQLLEQKRRQDEDAQLLACAARGPLSRGEVAALCGLSEEAAHQRLRRLTDAGKLVRVGMKYYPAGSAVPPEEQYAVLCAHLRTVGAAYRQELADVLRIGPRQCSTVLKRLTAEGQLVRTGQMYTLPESYV